MGTGDEAKGIPHMEDVEVGTAKTVSNHLAVLRNVGLVVDEKRGQQVFYRLGAPCVTKIFRCLEELREARETLR